MDNYVSIDTRYKQNIIIIGSPPHIPDLQIIELLLVIQKQDDIPYSANESLYNNHKSITGRMESQLIMPAKIHTVWATESLTHVFISAL